MKRISSDEVKKVAQLARLELNENEINQHAEPVSYTHLTLPTTVQV